MRITYIQLTRNFSFFPGIFKSVAILGPAIGYILGGVFLGIYTDVQRSDE